MTTRTTAATRRRQGRKWRPREEGKRAFTALGGPPWPTIDSGKKWRAEGPRPTRKKRKRKVRRGGKKLAETMDKHWVEKFVCASSSSGCGSLAGPRALQMDAEERRGGSKKCSLSPFSLSGSPVRHFPKDLGSPGPTKGQRQIASP